MSAPRSADEVYAEQVAQAAQAVERAVTTSAAQQASAGAWLTAGLPADSQAHPPGSANAPVD
jgi:hypothetical protein